MAKFKVGDRVRLTATCLSFPQGSEGVLIAPHALSQYPFKIKVKGLGKMAVAESEIELIEPGPKSIPARNLSGKHIGRVVTITTKDGIQISSALTLVRHLEGGVAVELKGVKAPGFTGAPFYLDPESEVIVNA